MKLSIVSFVALAVATAGCAHNTPPANNPSNPDNDSPAMGEPPARPSNGCPSCEKDNFDKEGQIVASGSRWIWNESKKAYEYLSSEEFHAKLVEAKQDVQSAEELMEKQLKAMDDAYNQWKVEEQKKSDATKK